MKKLLTVFVLIVLVGVLTDEAEATWSANQSHNSGRATTYTYAGPWYSPQEKFVNQYGPSGYGGSTYGCCGPVSQIQGGK